MSVKKRCLTQQLWLTLGALFLILLSPWFTMSANARTPRASAAQPWIMTFDDEFNGHSLDTKKWTASRGPTDNLSEPIQYFLPEDLKVEDGFLRIRSERRPVDGYEFTSGEISTLNKFAQAYGRIVVRCRFTVLNGVWSAAYLLPASGAWPPEIDIVEYLGRNPSTIYITNHWEDPYGRQQENENWVDPTTDWKQWHTFEIIWDPGVIRWLIDGQVRATIVRGVSDVPMYVRLNTAIGGTFAEDPSETGWPKTYDVDYVRVYRRANAPAPILGVTYVKPPGAPGPYGNANDEFGKPIVALKGAHGPHGANFASGASSPWTVWDALSVALLIALWNVAATARLKRPRMTIALAVAVGAASLWYLLWRIPLIDWNFWWISLPLFAAELFGVAQILGFHYTVWPRPEPKIAAVVDAVSSPVFILIPTVNEGRGVVEPTARGALAARERYRHAHPKSEVTIALCNDGFVAGVPHWSDMEDLATELGILCITRREGGGAKAGNLEHARQQLGAVGDALIVIFDADMAATPEFLLKTVPPFGDPKIGWVQTGQYYRNLENPVARWAHDQQMVFFETICPGKARLNAVFICGTNVVIRARALDEIGGLPQDSLTEDFAASVLLHGRWRSIYLPEVLASGLGPEDLSSYFTQQRRWAAGTLDVTLRRWRSVLLPATDHLTSAQRVQYALSGTHYLCGLSQVIFFVSPLLYLLTGVRAMNPVELPDFLRHFLPFWAVSQIANWYACGRRWRWRGAALGFAAAPVLTAALVSALRRRPGRFVVTDKRHRSGGAKRSLLPHFHGLALSVAALIAAVARPERGALGALSVLWVLYGACALLCAMRLAFAARAKAPTEAALLAAPMPTETWSLTDYSARRRLLREREDSDIPRV